MCPSIMIAICIKQHLNNIWIHKKVSIHNKVSNTEADLKKALLIKKNAYMFYLYFQFN